MEEDADFREEVVPKMKFEEFVSKVDLLHSTHRELRRGQSLMVVLGEVWIEKYREITGTDDDCFYNDATVILTMDKLEKEWVDDSRTGK